MGVEALVAYGFAREARRMLAGIVDPLCVHDTFYECYNPLDRRPAAGDRPAQAQFAWTAAHVILMARLFDLETINIGERQ